MAPVATGSIDEHRTRLTEIRGRLQEIDNDHAGEALPDDIREEWNALNEEADRLNTLVEELEARARVIEERANDPASNEDGAAFHTNKAGKARGDDIYDLSTVRSSVSNPDEATRELQDRAKRSIEQAQFPNERSDKAPLQAHVQRLLERSDDDRGTIARLILTTGSPTYKRAFGKYLKGQSRTAEEERALSLTGSAGGFAVPYELDPTIIPTSNLAVNPYRAISRVESITVDEWRGVSSAGITAAYAAEATEASDNAPTLAQPTISTEKAQAFVPFSIEVGQDWNSLQAEMAKLLQDAKDELEATKFTTGSGTNEPQGVITGATTLTTTAGTGAFVVADLYALESALGPRFRPRASLVMNRFVAQKIRQFDTAGGANLWIDNLRGGLDNNVPTSGQYGAAVLGYPAYEASAMAAALSTGSKIAVLGDFNYYVIVDRIGLNVEVIPHLFALANNRPSGQRGLYAYWRNGAGVVSANAFRVLITL